MSRFFVGQRVRIKWSNGWPELAGKEGVILGRPPASSLPINGTPGDWSVLPDGRLSNLLPCEEAPDGLAYFCPREDQLEPATDSYDVVSWETCAWMPEHLRVVA